MLTMTWSVVCDHCGATARIGSQVIPFGHGPADIPRSCIFGADVCPECLEKAKEAVIAALPHRKMIVENLTQ